MAGGIFGPMRAPSFPRLISPPPRQATSQGIGSGTSVTATMPSVPLTNGLFFAQFGTTVASPVVSISQTNVTWSLLHGASDSTRSRVELWIGRPTGGTPGTSVAATLTSSCNCIMAVEEWPPGTGLAGTVYGAYDTVGLNNYEISVSVPTIPGQLAFFIGSTNNGTEPCNGITGGPWIQMLAGTYCTCGYFWPEGNQACGGIARQYGVNYGNTLVLVQ